MTMSLVGPFSLTLLSMAWGTSGPPVAHQQTAPGALDLVGQVGARARTAAVQDDRLYLATGSQVKVLEPAGPGGGLGQIAQSGVGKSAIDQLVPQGRILYARGAAGDVLAFDISDPGAIRPVPGDPGVAWSAMAGVGGYLVGMGHGGLEVLDVGHGWPGFRVGAVDLDGGARHLALRGRYAYAAGYGKGWVIDLGDPTAPVVVAAMDLPRSPSALAVAADLLLVGGTSDNPTQAGVMVFSVANPKAPELIGVVPGLGFPTQSLAVAGDLALVSDGNGIRAVDISEPGRPRTGRRLHAPDVGAVVSLGSGGADGFAMIDARGVDLVDVAPDLRLSAARAFDAPHWEPLVDLATDGRYLWAADEARHLRLVDVADPREPVEIPVDGDHEPVALALGAGRDGKMLGYELESDALRVLEVTTSGAIAEVGRMAVDSAGPDIAIDAGRAYFQAAGARLVVADITAPAAPRELGRLPGEACPSKLAVARGHVYILCSDRDAVDIIAVGDPQAPEAVGTFDMGGQDLMDVAATEDYLLVLFNSEDPGLIGRETWIRIYSLEEPAAPRRVSLFAQCTDAVEGLGTFAVAVGCQGMLRWLGLAEGQAPRLKGSLLLALDSYDMFNRRVALAPGLVIAAGYLGVEIVSAPGLRPPRLPRLFLPAAVTP